ncbi:hypothetical protein ACWECR_32330, partial [Streptomyces sp. NPDC005056]
MAPLPAVHMPRVLSTHPIADPRTPLSAAWENGCGMNDEALDTAMTVGGREGYAASALGHFGA